MDKVKQQEIYYEVNNNHVILYLKALIDTGSSDTLLGDNLVGQIVKDKGLPTSVSSILDNNKSYPARQVQAYLRTGKVSVTVVKEFIKPVNSNLLVIMLGNILNISEVSREKYNLAEKFLRKPIQLVVGVLDSQTTPVNMEDRA